MFPIPLLSVQHVGYFHNFSICFLVGPLLHIRLFVGRFFHRNVGAGEVVEVVGVGEGQSENGEKEEKSHPQSSLLRSSRENLCLKDDYVLKPLHETSGFPWQGAHLPTDSMRLDQLKPICDDKIQLHTCAPLFPRKC